MPTLAASNLVAFAYTADRERSVAFYRDVLSLELVDSDGHGEAFAVGRARLRLTALPDFRPADHPVVGWDVEDIETAMTVLAAKGIEFLVYPGFGQDERGLWASPDGSTRLAWFNDPDGNVLMLSQG